MASKGHIAKTRDTAIAGLIDTGQGIAALLNIDPPNLNFFYRDSDYNQAEQLKAMAEYNRRVYAALDKRTESEPETEAQALTPEVEPVEQPEPVAEAPTPALMAVAKNKRGKK